MAGPGGYFVSIFRPRQSHFFSRLKKVPKKGEHAAMQDFGARDTLVFFWFLFRTDQIHHSIFVQISFVCRLRFWEAHISFEGAGFVIVCYGTMSRISLTLRPIEGLMSLSFTGVGKRDLGIWEQES
jgi:hypothetical protein